VTLMGPESSSPMISRVPGSPCILLPIFCRSPLLLYSTRANEISPYAGDTTPLFLVNTYILVSAYVFVNAYNFVDCYILVSAYVFFPRYFCQRLYFLLAPIFLSTPIFCDFLDEGSVQPGPDCTGCCAPI
jgi:hypothetical protein